MIGKLFQRLRRIPTQVFLILGLLTASGVAFAVDTTLEKAQVITHYSGTTYHYLDSFGYQPADASSIGGHIVPWKSRLTKLTLIVGDNLGGSGNTSVYVQKNGTTVASSTISIAYSATDGTASTVSGLDVAVAVGDVLTVRLGAVTGGSTSAIVSHRMDLIEQFD